MRKVYNIMKTKLAVLTAVLMSVCMLAGPSAMALRVVVEAGDQPFYVYGPSYWDAGYEYVWVPGHWGPHHAWVHGYYNRHGEFHKEYAHVHHHDHDHDHAHD